MAKKKTKFKIIKTKVGNMVVTYEALDVEAFIAHLLKVLPDKKTIL